MSWRAALGASHESRKKCNDIVFDLSVAHDFEDLHGRFKPQIVANLEDARRFIDIALSHIRNVGTREGGEGDPG